MNLLIFFNDTATTEIYTLSLHDALPICIRRVHVSGWRGEFGRAGVDPFVDGVNAERAAGTRDFGFACACKHGQADRKSTRLNSSHANNSYAVFCLEKKTTYLS